MGDEYSVAVLLGGLAFFIAIGVPIAFAMGMTTVTTILYISATSPFSFPLAVVFQKTSDGVDTFALLAIPFFVLAGAVMGEGGMAQRLVNFANIFVGFLRGGLALVNILSSMFFGGISGSSVADVSSIGSILIPMMKKQGYDDAFSVNVTITSATQGVIIPPSHNAVLFAYSAGGSVSIAALFLAGIIPGIMIGLILMVLAVIISNRRGYPKGELVPLREAVKQTWEAIPGLITIVIIVGGVVGGVFNATEAAAVAVVWSLFVTLVIYRDLPLQRIPHMLHNVVKTVAMVMIVIGFASAFGYLMTLMQVPQSVGNFLIGLSDNKYVIIILVNLMLIALGTFMDMAPLILVTTPLFLPVMTQLGFSPVHFGIVMLLNLSIGLITPPVGTTLFVGCAVGKVSIEKVTRSMWPFWLAMLIVLMLVTFIPELTLYVPNAVYGDRLVPIPD